GLAWAKRGALAEPSRVRVRATVRVRARIECSVNRGRVTPLPTKIPGLCGQTATESPHDRQDYGRMAAPAEVSALRQRRRSEHAWAARRRRVNMLAQGRSRSAAEGSPHAMKAGMRKRSATRPELSGAPPGGGTNPPAAP